MRTQRTAHLAAADDEDVSFVMVVDDESDDTEETQSTAFMAARFDMTKDENTSSFTKKLDEDGRPNVRFYKPRQTCEPSVRPEAFIEVRLQQFG